MKTRILFLITLLCAVIAGVQSVHAAPITVMNNNDSGAGSLRQALADANDGDTINFAVAVTGTITLTSGELLVNDSITISGPGANTLAVNGNAASRVFHVGAGKTVTIDGLTIMNRVPSYPGGGGIYSDSATLTVTNSTISGNSGGIYNDGREGLAGATLTVTNSTISGNSNSGIYNNGETGSATASITNSTLSGNSAPQSGGGIYNSNPLGDGSATLAIGHTILNTGGSGSGENIYNDSGTVSSLGYNLSRDATGPNGGTDLLNTDPLLGPLQDNGGPTFTIALQPNSPAINAGDPNFTPPPDYDQRGTGYPRVVNGRIDIGAFEVQAAYAAQIQQPINADGTSVFNVRRGVVPVKFTLTLNGVATCDLPPATIAVTRTAGGTIGSVDESVYTGSADTGSNFRIDSCQYVYNLSASALGVGTYRVDIMINGQLVSSATFMLK